MKNIITAIIGTVIFLTGNAQMKYHRAKIYYQSPKELLLLANQGVAIDHVKFKKGVYIESDFSDYELGIVRGLGLKYTIEIEDVQEFYRNQNNEKSLSKNQGCGTVYNYQVPGNYNGGSMGGFLTYSEMLQELDDMAALYPNLITVKSAISNFSTVENRPIYWVKISDNPNVDEAEPEMLYTAVHHAREPGSLQQTIFYMWYLLENYNTNDEVKAIIDNAELFFIPCINPDGYIYNEMTDPAGGGMWRKNRRDNGDGTFGVDLNRNYSYQWGGAGTSTNTSSDVYLGPSAFSEVETQAVKWFCEQHDFKIALNSHTYSQLLLYPFGYALNQPTPDNSYFEAISGVMVEQNGYVNQISAALYPAAGDSDDWMYGETSTHNKILAMTPEVGSSFWPASSTITSMCQGMVYHNLMAANFILNYAETKDVESEKINLITGHFNYEIQRLGLGGTGNFTVEIEPLSSNITSVGGVKNYTAMNLLQTEVDSIAYTLSSTIQNGDLIEYVLITDNGLYARRDTVRKVFGDFLTVAFDDFTVFNNWFANSWGITNTYSYSPSTSVTDSPNGNYTDGENNIIQLKDTVSLENAISGMVSFYARWDIEAGFDYVVFEVSTDFGQTWQAQCGKYTNPGTVGQLEGTPLYDGQQNAWVKEEINLSEYLGQKLILRFRLVSDQAVTGDGFYFDDFRVEALYGSGTSNGIEENTTSKFFIYPNPSQGQVTISYRLTNLEKATFELYDLVGKRVYAQPLKSTQGQEIIDLSFLPAGIYHGYLSERGQRSKAKKIILAK